MSLWDKYFAPGDLRRRQQQQSQLQPPSPPPQHTATKHEQPQPPVVIVKPPPPRIGPADRTRRQNALLYGGIAFTALSLLVTRRALQRKMNAQVVHAQALANKAVTTPTTTTPPPATTSNVDGSLEALSALGYATLNVFSFAILGVGLAMTYFDVADLEDLREGVRGQAGYNAGDSSESEREIEAWVAEVLARRDDGTGRLREGVLERVAEIEIERGRRRMEEEEEEGRRKGGG